MKKSRKKRKLKTTIFIACEGQNTEPNYFERIKEDVEEFDELVITVYPDDTVEKPKTDAVGLVDVAIEKKGEGFDELWVVFDKDGYTKHEEAFAKANNEGINIAFSSIAFEHWVLLHYEQDSTAYPKSQELIDKKLVGGNTYFPKYGKSKKTDSYPALQQYTPKAIENAAWLRWKQRTLLGTNPIYDINPITTIDHLVSRLLGISRNLHWTNLGTPTVIEECEITISLFNEGVRVSVKNQSQKAIVSNSISLSIDTSAGIEEAIAPQSSIIDPDKMVILDFKAKSLLTQPSLLRCAVLNSIVLVPLP